MDSTDYRESKVGEIFVLCYSFLIVSTVQFCRSDWTDIYNYIEYFAIKIGLFVFFVLQTILGWYKIRRNSSCRISMRERTVIRNLLNRLSLDKGILRELNILFLIFFCPFYIIKCIVLVLVGLTLEKFLHILMKILGETDN